MKSKHNNKNKEPITAILAHFFMGVFSALCAPIFPSLSFTMFLLFIIYEVDEEFHIKDNAYKDILQYGIGLITGTVMLILLILFVKP